jgi:hypothetical protein
VDFKLFPKNGGGYVRKNRGFANGLRSGQWSENKFSKLVPYSPYSTEMYKIIKQMKKLLIFIMGFSSGHINPVKDFFIP